MSRKTFGLSLVLGAFVALAFTGVALATHIRPQGATPDAIKLVPRFKPCPVGAGTATHAPPINISSCPSPSLESTVLTTGLGTAAGSVYLATFCNPGGSNGTIPPCDVPTGVDYQDIKVTSSVTDVRCVAAGPGCSGAQNDFTGQVFVELPIQWTDHSNEVGGIPAGGVCPNGPGSSPCVPATTVLYNFRYPVPCTIVGSVSTTPGSTCAVTSTFDTFVPGMVKDAQRAILDLGKVNLYDAGPDGSITPPAPSTCPPNCGTGDESVFWTQGIYAP